jgi:hypothetical protein
VVPFLVVLPVGLIGADGAVGGILLLLACAVAGLLISFTDPAYFGWTEEK